MKPSRLLLAAALLAPASVRADPSGSSPALASLQSDGGGLTPGTPDASPADPRPAAAPTAPPAAPAPITEYVGAGGAFMYQPKPDGTIGTDSDNEADAENYDYGQLLEGESVEVLGGPAPTDPDYAVLKDWVKVRVNRVEANGAPTEAWIRKSSLQTTLAGLNPPPAFTAMKPAACRDAFIAALKTFVGVPYKWGGTSKSGVDCSGLVVAALLQAHCTQEAPPRTAAAQQAKARSVLGGGAGVPAGTLVFVGSPAHHVYVALGPGDADKPNGIIEAAHTGTTVSLNDFRPGSGGDGDLLSQLDAR